MHAVICSPGSGGDFDVSLQLICTLSISPALFHHEYGPITGVPPKGLGKGLVEKKNRGAANGQGLARLTRAAAAAGAEATTLMGLGLRALRSRNG